MFIREHSLEEHYLRRRLELLDYLDSFARDEFYNTDEEDRMSEDDVRLVLLRKHYADVLNPYELNETLKNIYPAHQYGPEPVKE
jgi:hypothetical protein